MCVVTSSAAVHALSRLHSSVVSDWLAVAVPVENNEEDKKEKKQPKLKDDRMNQPDGVCCFHLCIYYFVSPFSALKCLQCYDTVGWASGRAVGL